MDAHNEEQIKQEKEEEEDKLKAQKSMDIETTDFKSENEESPDMRDSRVHSERRSRERESNWESSDRYRSRERRERGRSSSPERRRDSPSYKRRRRDDWEERERSPRGERDRYIPQERNRQRRKPRDEDDRRRRRDRNGSLFEGSMKSLSQFLEHQDDRLSQSEKEKRYEEYKTQFSEKQARTFFEEHKNDEWFKEKYDPHYLEKKWQERLELANTKLHQFSDQLEQGTLDYKLNPPSSSDTEPMEKDSYDSSTEDKSVTEAEDSSEKKDTMETSETSSSSKTSSNTLFVKAIPTNIGRTDLLQFFKQSDGFHSLTLSEPQTQRNFQRLGWAVFSTPEDAMKALENLNKQKIKDFEVQLNWHNKPTEENKIKTAPPVSSEQERISIDIEQAQRLCELLDKEKSIENNPLFRALPESKDIDFLDKTITYMRWVHNFCYYCGEEYEHEDDLRKKCGYKHIRTEKKDSDVKLDVSTDSWANSLDSKIKHRLNNPEDPDIYTGKKEIERKLEKFYQKNIMVKGKQRYRCLLCSKLFAGEHYVRKHQNLKHPDSIEQVKEKALSKQFFKNYLADPKRPSQMVQTGLMPFPHASSVSMRRGMWPTPPVAYPTGVVPPMGFYPPPYFSVPQTTGQRGRGRRGRAERHRPPQHPPESRALKNYVDLDAPKEERVQIEYRTAVDYSEL